MQDALSPLLGQLAIAHGAVAPRHLMEERRLAISGFDISFAHHETDPGAFYLTFDFGVISSGRTLKVFRLLLEANLLIYAQDQAQLGMNSESGGILLIVRVPFASDVNGEWLLELLEHYVKHGHYWRENIFSVGDEMYEALATGVYVWMRA